MIMSLLSFYRSSKSSGFGIFNMFRGLVGSKTLTKEDMASAMDKMRDHLTGELLVVIHVQGPCRVKDTHQRRHGLGNG